MAARADSFSKQHKNYNQYPYPLALSYQRTQIITAYICLCASQTTAEITASDPVPVPVPVPGSRSQAQPTVHLSSRNYLLIDLTNIFLTDFSLCPYSTVGGTARHGLSTKATQSIRQSQSHFQDTEQQTIYRSPAIQLLL